MNIQSLGWNEKRSIAKLKEHVIFICYTLFIFILSSISSSWELWSVNLTLIHENSELKIFKNIKLLAKIWNNGTIDLLGTNLYKTLELCW